MTDKQHYADRAEAAIRAAHSELLGKRPSGQSAERGIERVLTDLMHLADWRELDWRRCIDRAKAIYDREMVPFYAAEREPRGYSGWHRIHDDNKAEGRPIGGQWNSRGVNYSNGYKVRDPRRSGPA